jgi:hypothetical protein
MRLPFNASDRLASLPSTHHTSKLGYFSSTCLTFWAAVLEGLVIELTRSCCEFRESGPQYE